MSFVPTPQSYAAILGEIHRLMYFFGFFSCLGLMSAADIMPHPSSHDITQSFSIRLFFVLECSGQAVPGSGTGGGGAS